MTKPAVQVWAVAAGQLAGGGGGGKGSRGCCSSPALRAAAQVERKLTTSGVRQAATAEGRLQENAARPGGLTTRAARLTR